MMVFRRRGLAVPAQKGWPSQVNARLKASLRPISQMILSLLGLLDSNFPGNSLWAWEFHPLKLKIPVESNPLKSRILVRRLAVSRPVSVFLRYVLHRQDSASPVRASKADPPHSICQQPAVM